MFLRAKGHHGYHHCCAKVRVHIAIVSTTWWLSIARIIKESEQVLANNFVVPGTGLYVLRALVANTSM